MPRNPDNPAQKRNHAWIRGKMENTKGLTPDQIACGWTKPEWDRYVLERNRAFESGPPEQILHWTSDDYDPRSW